MTDSLRAKQNMEILDVFKDLHSQVVGLQNKQVQQFPESLKAKTQRDLGAEVNVDKAVENINKIIETKLGALEFVVQNIVESNRGGDQDLASAANRTIFYNSLSQVNNSGDVIPLYNGIVRAYKEVGVSRETQQIIKVKVQELTPNLEAVCYGLNQAIDTIFEKRILNPSIARVILDLLRSLSVYTELKSQVESNPPRFESFSVELLDRVFKNIFERQSADRLTVLKEYAPRGMLVSATIRNIPDFKTGDIKERVKAIEEELGVKLPQNVVDRLNSLSSVDLSNAINELRSQVGPAYKSAFDQDVRQILNRLQAISTRLENIFLDTTEGRKRMESLQQEVDLLEEKNPLDEAEAEAQYVDIPEEFIQPQSPNVDDFFVDFGDEKGFFDEDAYFKAMREYNDLRDEWFERYLEIIQAEDHNASIEDQLTQSKAERRQIIDSLEREYDVIARERSRYNNEIDQLIIESTELDNNLQTLRTRNNQALVSVAERMLTNIKDLKLQAESKRRARELEAPRGQPAVDDEKKGEGKPIEERALSSMKKGYGRQEMVVPKKKKGFMNFEDCANDCYA